MKKIIIALLLLSQSLCYANPTIVNATAGAIRQRASGAVADGFVGYITPPTTDSVGNLSTNDGVYATYTVEGTGLKRFSRMGCRPNNTDTAKHFECAIYSSDKSTKLAYTASTSITVNANWNYANLVSTVDIEGGTSVVLIYNVYDDSDWQARGESDGSKTVYYDGTWRSSDSTIDEANSSSTTAELAIFADNGQTTPEN